MNTGMRIKARRKQLGMSAETLASIIGVSPTTVYRYENGDIEKVDSTKLEPIAVALHTTPAYLMGWENDASAQMLKDLGEELTAPSRSKEWRMLSEGLAELQKRNPAAFDATYSCLNSTYPEIFMERTDDDANDAES